MRYVVVDSEGRVLYIGDDINEAHRVKLRKYGSTIRRQEQREYV